MSEESDMSNKGTRIVCISDTHGYHDRVRVPPGDILIHSGDCTGNGSIGDLGKFLIWFERQPCKQKILVAGNHDWCFEQHLGQPMVTNLAPSAFYLQDSGATIRGIKFWGSPYQPRFLDWAFNVDRGDAIRKHWDLIPNDTDVLITHGPPMGFLDGLLDVQTGGRKHLGCADLYVAVLKTKPRLHVFGHIHAGYGNAKLVHDDGTVTHFVNAAICNEGYKPVNQPMVYYF